MSEERQSLSWLRILRELRGWSQEDLAREAGLSKSAISILENTHRNPAFTTIKKVSKALGFPYELVFPGDEEPTVADVLYDYLNHRMSEKE